jgi:hypothetical protein
VLSVDLQTEHLPSLDRHQSGAGERLDVVVRRARRESCVQDANKLVGLSHGEPTELDEE